jgi:integral membrane protein
MGLLEGSSLLILLFLAMPLKYFFGIPEAVSVVGSIHGFLFVSYCLMIAYMTFIVRWPFVYSVIAVIVAFIPFGNIIFDRKLDKVETV